MTIITSLLSTEESKQLDYFDSILLELASVEQEKITLEQAKQPSPRLTGLLDIKDTIFAAIANKSIKAIGVATEYGTGKSKEIGAKLPCDNKAYISHRVVLELQAKDKYGEADCINSCGDLVFKATERVRKGEEGWLVLDEITAVMHSMLTWHQVQFYKITPLIREFVKAGGRVLFLDRDLTEQRMLWIADFFGITREQTAYFEAPYQARNKPVIIADKLEQLFYALYNSEPGIKCIFSDSKDKAIRLIENELMTNGYKLFTVNSNNSYNAMSIIEDCKTAFQAGEQVVLLGSPSIQEGYSLEGDEFTFCSYLMLQPHNRMQPVKAAMQALHRVRNGSAIRVMCILANDSEKQLLTFQEVLRAEKAKAYYTKANLEYLKGCIRAEGFSELLDDYDQPSIVQLLADFHAESELDKADLKGRIAEQLEKSGYTPSALAEWDLPAIAKSTPAPKKQKFDPPTDEVFLKFSLTEEGGGKHLLSHIKEAGLDTAFHSDQLTWQNEEPPYSLNNRLVMLKKLYVLDKHSTLQAFDDPGFCYRMSKHKLFAITRWIDYCKAMWEPTAEHNMATIRSKLIARIESGGRNSPYGASEELLAFTVIYNLLGGSDSKPLKFYGDSFTVKYSEILASTAVKHLAQQLGKTKLLERAKTDDSSNNDMNWLYKSLNRCFGLETEPCGKQKAKRRLFW